MNDPRFHTDRLATHQSGDIHAILAHIAEEAGELVQIAMKAQRWGLDSQNPIAPNKGNNFRLLLAEYNDVTMHVRTLLRLADRDGFHV